MIKSCLGWGRRPPRFHRLSSQAGEGLAVSGQEKKTTAKRPTAATSQPMMTTSEFRKEIKNSFMFSSCLSNFIDSSSTSMRFQKYRKRLNHRALALTLAQSRDVIGYSATCDALDAIDYAKPVISKQGYIHLINQLLDHPRVDAKSLRIVFGRYRARCGHPSNSIVERVVMKLLNQFEVDVLVAVLEMSPKYVPSDSLMVNLTSTLVPTGNFDTFSRLLTRYSHYFGLTFNHHQLTISRVLKKIIVLFSNYNVLGQRYFTSADLIESILKAVDNYHHRLLHEGGVNFVDCESSYLVQRLSELNNLNWDHDNAPGELEREVFYRRTLMDKTYALDESLRTTGLSNQLHVAMSVPSITDVSTYLQAEYCGRNLLYVKSFWDECEDDSVLPDKLNLAPCAHASTRPDQVGVGGNFVQMMNEAINEAINDVVLNRLHGELDGDAGAFEDPDSDSENISDDDDSDDGESDSESDDDESDDDESDDEISAEDDVDEDEDFSQFGSNSISSDTAMYGKYKNVIEQRVKNLFDTLSGEINNRSEVMTLMTKMKYMGMAVWVDMPIPFAVNDITEQLRKSNPDTSLYYDDEIIMSQLVDGDDTESRPPKVHHTAEVADQEGKNDSPGRWEDGSDGMGATGREGRLLDKIDDTEK